MDISILVMVMLFSIILFGISAYLLIIDRPPAALTALSFVFLFVIILTISKYKHIHGFGFEAEMWESKQQEAADLVQQLRAMALVNGTQLSIVTSQVGYMGRTISNPQIMNYANEIKKQMRSLGGVNADDQEKMLNPLYQRIESNFENAIQFEIQKKYQNFVQSLDKISGASDSQRIEDAKESNSIMQLMLLTYKSLPLEEWKQRIKNVLDRKLFKSDPNFTERISALEEDLEYFHRYHSLRRDIDVNNPVP